MLLLTSVFARTYRLRVPSQPIIFDERYYVNAARVILGWHVPAGDPYAGSKPGLDPNLEHPPLGKLLMAGSMKLFGDGPLGWRLTSVLAGMACIVLVYAIVRAVAGDGWLAVLAATIFSFDNLVLVHSRIGTLDMPYLALLLAGAWCWLRGRPLLAGIACAVAALIKLPAVYGLVALVLLALGKVVSERARQRMWNRAALRGCALLLLGFGIVWFFGLWLLDIAVTPYSTPWAHLHHMVSYGFSLSHRGGPTTVESNPWQWPLNDVQMPYFRVVESASTHGHVVASQTVIDFRGAMNPVLLVAAPFALAYVAWRAWRVRDALSRWVLAWVAATYLSYYPLVLLTHRTTYIFYFLPTLPSLAVAIAQLLRQSRLPSLVTWVYVLALAVAFAVYFPFHRVF